MFVLPLIFFLQCLVLLLTSLPAAISAPVTASDGLIEGRKFQTWQQRPSTQPHHCHCGHRFAVTKTDHTMVYTEAEHHYYHATAVTVPNPPAVYTGASHHHDHVIAVTVPNPPAVYTGAGHHHNHVIVVTVPIPPSVYTGDDHHHGCSTPDPAIPQQMPNSTPSPTDETVKEEITENGQYYDEAGEDDDDDYKPLFYFIPIILLAIFFLVYPSLYFYSNQRKKTHSFYLSSDKCGCTAKYTRCSK